MMLTLPFRGCKVQANGNRFAEFWQFVFSNCSPTGCRAPAARSCQLATATLFATSRRPLRRGGDAPRTDADNGGEFSSVADFLRATAPQEPRLHVQPAVSSGDLAQADSGG
jgi:hypothetical protein